MDVSSGGQGDQSGSKETSKGLEENHPSNQVQAAPIPPKSGGASVSENIHSSLFTTNACLKVPEEALYTGGLHDTDPPLPSHCTCDNACRGCSPSEMVQSELPSIALEIEVVLDRSVAEGPAFPHSNFLQQLSGRVPAQGSDLNGFCRPLDMPVHNGLRSHYFNPVSKSAVCRDIIASACRSISVTENGISCQLNLVNEETNHNSISAVESEGSSSLGCNSVGTTQCSDQSSWQNIDDIDALLSSDSEDDDLTNTGHFPDSDADSDCDSNVMQRSPDDIGSTQCSDPSLWQENIDDIDALLSSDDEDNDEATTVHFSHDDADSDCDSNINGRRSVDSRFSDGCSMSSTEDPASAENCHTNFTVKNENVTTSDTNCSSKLSAKARRRNIKRKMKILKKIIPGGTCMNAAAALGEAIQYLKSLQRRVQELDPWTTLIVELSEMQSTLT